MSDSSLIQSAQAHEANMGVLTDRAATWILGYLLTNGAMSITKLRGSVSVGENEDLDRSIERLFKAKLIHSQNGILTIAVEGIALLENLGLSAKSYIKQNNKKEISCDLLLLDNIEAGSLSDLPKRTLIDSIINHPQWYGPPGQRYGFVDCDVLADDVLFGYFTQEYLSHTLKYDENLHRQEDWDTKNYNLLFIWPLRAKMFLLQDSRFYSAQNLNMSSSKTRILTILAVLGDYYKIKVGDLYFKPYERTVSQPEMMEKLMTDERPVVEAQINLDSFKGLPERLPIFNPREDYNSMLRQIIQDYELPNLSIAKFSATRLGTLAKSKIVKSLALAGQIKQIKLGRGRGSKTVRQLIPTHIGRVDVGEPATQEDITNILAFLQNQLGISLSQVEFGSTGIQSQIKFEI